ncbi:cbb3-type cytochrome c oxidase subunit I [Halorientalis litorea]|jgi:cytochrome c oxidase subunit 1|uniref:cbb3-type cytochrome c oxidase subunit I n=1 Tax=Halorientalis litorea TaxID=2931977 RepID=UPI001FF2BD97|nr:cbb3-type cytochrome c oxidase subunit I [Halorientalis litorea]
MAGEQLALTVLMGALLVAIVALSTRLENWRSYTPLAGGGALGEESTTVHREKPAGIVRWLTTVDHKDIGILYGVYAVLAFAVGGLMAFLIRAQLVVPSGAIIENSFYNAILTSHGITMLFLFGTPIIAAFANYFVPLLIGADDMAFPRINAIAFWLLPPGALLVWGGFLIPGIGASQTSWTMYAPLSIEQTQAGADLMLLGLHLTGVAATMGAINFIATIFTERGDDVNWANLDIFSWTILTQSALILFAFPLLGSALIMLLMDRNLATTFFTVDGGGALLWQHLFWFFGHPEVYILVLPPMGLVSYILPRFAGRKLFGFKFVVYSTLAIGVLSFGVWAHHMFSTGMDVRLASSFMAVSLAIAIPSAVKTFNWITTLWNGKIRLTAPMLFCIGFVSNFIIGGVTGVFLAAIPVDKVLHDTYYVVGHFHYIVMGVIGFAVFAGIYYWFPIFTGRMYQRKLGKWHFWLSMIGTNITFFAMLVLGYLGMPRRYATYEFDAAIAPLAQVINFHLVATVGATILLVGQLIFVWNIVQSWLEGPHVGPDPWNLKEEAPELYGREYVWHENRLETALADGGEEEDVATDGGEPTDAADEDAPDAADE